MRSRPISELLALVIVATICLSILAIGGTIGLALLFQPDRDISSLTAILSDAIKALLGAMAGFIAARTETKS